MWWQSYPLFLLSRSWGGSILSSKKPFQLLVAWRNGRLPRPNVAMNLPGDPFRCTAATYRAVVHKDESA